MEPTTFVIAGVTALAILLIAFGAASSGSGTSINVRLARYASSKEELARPVSQQNLGELISGSEALSTFNKAMEQRDFGANIARDIARADLRRSAVATAAFAMRKASSVSRSPSRAIPSSIRLAAISARSRRSCEVAARRSGEVGAARR